MLIALIIVVLTSCNKHSQEKNSFNGSNLVYKELSPVWDEAMPLGNGMLGKLVWQKNGKLRFSLDRADLWDLRPMANIDFDKWKFEDVYQHWKNNTYGEVQRVFDAPYNALPAPSKIPGGALEFNIGKLGPVKEVVLDIESAVCTVEWDSGTKLTAFVHAEKPIGWYKFENLEEPLAIELISPAYNRENTEGYTSISTTDLNKLGYGQGDIIKTDNKITYNQTGWGDFAYQISTEWEEGANSLTGTWSVTSENEGWEKTEKASDIVSKELKGGIKTARNSHNEWWGNYWAKSSVGIPDSLLQRQYYMEMYKFGSVARADAPPISLQAVWTADHGKLPPWKGDYHHDLNTQLNYWPSYAGNHLDLEEGYINWLWECRPVFKKYTKDYFGVDGMNVPGVCTLEGEPMGGWIQYAFGKGIGAWLSHHFYLHWQYTQDRVFLEKKAYPWIKDILTFFDEISVIGEDGKRKLKISSSPEVYDNSRKAWFAETTNFDLALIRWNLETAAELARELSLEDDAKKWEGMLQEWPQLAIDGETGLMFAPGFPYNESHRHLSHLLAFHPLGLIDYSNGEADRKIIENTLLNLKEQGSEWWTGYSFSWQGNLYARAFDGENAAEVLTTFARCFCLRNSFHVNGDQCKEGHSNFTYRPFTLEGNFAFASAIQEMLIQSHTGIVRIFPAIPASWNNSSFDKLRTVGAFLVSGELKDGQVYSVKVYAEKGGIFKLKNPFDGAEFTATNENYTVNGDIIEAVMEAGQELKFSIK